MPIRRKRAKMTAAAVGGIDGGPSVGHAAAAQSPRSRLEDAPSRAAAPSTGPDVDPRFPSICAHVMTSVEAVPADQQPHAAVHEALRLLAADEAAAACPDAARALEATRRHFDEALARNSALVRGAEGVLSSAEPPAGDGASHALTAFVAQTTTDLQHRIESLERDAGLLQSMQSEVESLSRSIADGSAGTRGGDSAVGGRLASAAARSPDVVIQGQHGRCVVTEAPSLLDVLKVSPRQVCACDFASAVHSVCIGRQGRGFLYRPAGTRRACAPPALVSAGLSGRRRRVGRRPRCHARLGAGPAAQSRGALAADAGEGASCHSAQLASSAHERSWAPEQHLCRRHRRITHTGLRCTC